MSPYRTILRALIEGVVGAALVFVFTAFVLASALDVGVLQLTAEVFR